MQNVLAKITMIVGVLGVVLPALAPLVKLDAGAVGIAVQALSALVAAVGGLLHTVPGTVSAPVSPAPK